jgi:hypothetical protein
MTDATVPPDSAPRRRAPSRHALVVLPLVLAGVFSAPGPALGAGGWLLVALAGVAVHVAARLLSRLRVPHLGAGAGLGLAPLAGYAAAHPDLTQPWGAVWLAAFALLWGAGAGLVRAALARARDQIPAERAPDAPPARDRALEVPAWLYRGAEVCLIPAIARVMESVGQPLSTMPAAAAFAVWMGVVGLLHLELRRAEESRPAFRGAPLVVGAMVLALVLVVRAMSRGGL